MNVGMLIGGPRSNLALIHSEGEVSLYFFFLLDQKSSVRTKSWKYFLFDVSLTK